MVRCLPASWERVHCGSGFFIKQNQEQHVDAQHFCEQARSWCDWQPQVTAPKPFFSSLGCCWPSLPPCAAKGTLPPHMAVCSRLEAAVMVQEHHFGDGVSELGSAGIHLLKRALGLGQRMPSIGPCLLILGLLTIFGRSRRERVDGTSAGL